MNLPLNSVILGDCLEVMKTFPDKSVDLVVTDPPYGVEWQSHRREVLYDKIEDDDNTDWVLPVFKEIYRVMKDDSLCVSFYGWPEVDVFMGAWKQVGLTPKITLYS